MRSGCGNGANEKTEQFLNVTASVNVTRYSDLELTTQLNLGDVHTAMDGLKIACV